MEFLQLHGRSLQLILLYHRAIQNQCLVRNSDRKGLVVVVEEYILLHILLRDQDLFPCQLLQMQNIKHLEGHHLLAYSLHNFLRLCELHKQVF